MTVHVLNVVRSSMPKNRPTSQKPESLTCDSTVAPPAIAVLAFRLQDARYVEAGQVRGRGRLPVPWGEVEVDVDLLGDGLTAAG